MVEERNNDQGDLAQTEDAVTVPLTDGEKQVSIDVKGEEDSLEATHAIGGLTKDELMKYAKDPFWVRLRILFMALFWLGWLAMLALAVLIIVQAPRCPPPPSSTWLQQDAIIQMDVDTPPEKATSLMAEANLNSLYIPSLMDPEAYGEISKDYAKQTVLNLLQVVTAAGLKVVTDFTPSNPALLLPFHQNASGEEKYSSQARLSADHLGGLQELFLHWKATYNVTGFLVDWEAMNKNPSMYNITYELNQALNDEDIAFGAHSVDVRTLMPSPQNFSPFKTYLNTSSTKWTYFKAPVPPKAQDMGALLLALVGLPGTPLLMQTPNIAGETFLQNVAASLSPLTEEAVNLRSKDSILYGLSQYANTSDHVLAFTRTLKGTPGYAVAVNTHPTDSAVVKFTGLKHIPEKGNLAFNTSAVKSKGSKMNLEKVEVGPNTGILVQFVAKYD